MVGSERKLVCVHIHVRVHVYVCVYVCICMCVGITVESIVVLCPVQCVWCHGLGQQMCSETHLRHSVHRLDVDVEEALD